jgi:hypothetical protein
LLLVNSTIGNVFPEGSSVTFRDFEKTKRDMHGEWEFGVGFWVFSGVMFGFSVVGIFFTVKNQILMAKEKRFRDLSAEEPKNSDPRAPGEAGQGKRQGTD